MLSKEAHIATEVELKLLARPEDLPAIKQALVAMKPGSASWQELLISTYYDTPDLALKQQAMTLRVRERGGQLIQTVKTGDLGAGDILSRGEWEDRLFDHRPDLAAEQSGPHLPQGLGENLRSVFVTDVTRTAYEIEPAPGTEIEAAVDEGEIKEANGDRTEPVSEIELELKRGDAAALYDLALKLLDVAPIRIEFRSKSERGYRLVDRGETPPAAIHAAPVALDHEMPVRNALQKIGRSCFAQFIRNEAAVLADEPEGVHQMRVALRRVRSAVSSLKDQLPAEDHNWMTEQLRWLGSTLGPARNLDVFAIELLPVARDGLPEEPGWDDLATTLLRVRHQANREVKDAIVSKQYTATVLQLLRWFEGQGCREHPVREGTDAASASIGTVAAAVLDRRRRRVRKRSKGFGRLTPPERHKLRIAAKKLRYTTELFGSLYSGDCLHRFLNTLKRVQGSLGYANDVRVAHEFVPELFARTQPGNSAIHAWITLLEWHDQVLAQGERRLRKQVDRLREASPFWRE
jgi:inorganic triphosphatase YgiF